MTISYKIIWIPRGWASIWDFCDLGQGYENYLDFLLPKNDFMCSTLPFLVTCIEQESAIPEMLGMPKTSIRNLLASDTLLRGMELWISMLHTNKHCHRWLDKEWLLTQCWLLRWSLLKSLPNRSALNWVFAGWINQILSPKLNTK